MAVLFRDSDLDGLLSPQAAIDAVEEVFRLEAEGRTNAPPRLNTDAPHGWLRLMPAIVRAEDGSSTMGLKAMNLNQETGVRYVTLLYDAETGELEAILDAARLTRLRTAAVTALACRLIRPDEMTELGLLGSGNEARGHAAVFKAAWPELDRVVVHSPNEERRERFAQDMAEELGIAVDPVDDPREAAACSVVLLASKASTPVVDADSFRPGALLLSIGSTRPDLRELDELTFSRATSCVCDAPAQLEVESGDVMAALAEKYLAREEMLPLADLVSGRQKIQWPPNDLVIFKSVGTALQDLAVSEAARRACAGAGRGLDLGAFPVEHVTANS